MNRTGKIVIIVIMVLIILALGVVGVLLYFQGKYLPYLDKIVTVPFLEQSPETVVWAMQKNMANITTAHYQLESEIIWSSEQSPLTVISEIVFDGGFEETVIGQLDLKNEIKIQNLNFLANFEVRSTKEKNYFRIYEVPAIPFIDLAKIKDKWYEYTPSALNDVQNETLVKIKDFLSNSKVIKVIKRLPDEEINNQLIYHYLVEVDTDNIQNILALLSSDIKKEQELNINELAGQQFEMWVGKKDNYLYKLDGAFNNQAITANFSLYISQFNQKVAIEEPSGWYPITDFSNDLFNQTNFLDIPVFGYLVGFDTEEFIEDPDQDELYTVWENMFGTDPNKPDTDGDGYQDGDEVRNGYNPKGEGRLFQ